VTATYSLDKFINGLLGKAQYEYDKDPEELALTALEIVRLCVQAADSMECLRCQFCGVDTVEIGEWYWVTDAVWDRYGPPEGCACIGCLEERMGRRLTPDDFPDFPINTDICHRSVRLRGRLQPALFGSTS
jgi:hypothetical protein